jgi:hypothetical protein
MTGKVLAIILLLSGLFAGGALYYLQVYGYYDEVALDPGRDVQLVAIASNQSEPIAYEAFRAIDADSSPIRYRACFTTSADPRVLSETYVMVEDAEPRNAPGWFDCFDAGALVSALEAGTARTFLGVKNIHFGVDRLVAITDDGRGFVWHDLNDCGDKAYDGTIVGEECPPRPGDAARTN